MKKKIILLFLFFYFLIIFQNSFLVHFSWQGLVPNLVLIVLVLLNLFERPERNLGIAAGFLAGFFLDVFSFGSGLFFGFWTIISLAISIFIKFILRKHVQIPIIKKL